MGESRTRSQLAFRTARSATRRRPSAPWSRRYACARASTSALPCQECTRPIERGGVVHANCAVRRSRAGRGPGRNSASALGHRDGARAGAPAAVRGRERLVQVEVHDVEAHVAGAHDTEDRVQVRAVVVEQAADLVDGRGDRVDLLFEEPERVRVREHDARHVAVEDRRAARPTSTSPRSSEGTVTTS